MSKVGSPTQAELSPNSKEASFQEKENEDPNSMKLLQRELNDIAPQKYEIKSYLGRGSYGVVVAAEDASSSEKVAIKRIYPDVLRNPFLGTRVVREIKLLSHFNHPNIIGIRNLFVTKQQGKESVWMVMDIMDMDLQALLRSGQNISEQHVQFFMAQILSALECIHEAGVIHRDLTPANCLLDINCDLRICDFGLAREEDNFMTDYVVMRWYRAPELLMQLPNYNSAVDMWAAGCILAQMLHDGKPLFRGTSSLHQFESIIDVLGTPSDEVLHSLGASAAAKLACQKKKAPPVDLSTLFHLPDGATISAKCADLLKRLLAFNPKDRCTAKQAQRHSYMAHVGYRVDSRPPPFSFPVHHEFEIHEVMDQLRQIQAQKSWGHVEAPLERLCSSNLSTLSLSLRRPESCIDARTALMNWGSMREGRTRSVHNAHPPNPAAKTDTRLTADQIGDIAANHVDSFGSSGDEASTCKPHSLPSPESNVFCGIPTLQDRMAEPVS